MARPVVRLRRRSGSAPRRALARRCCVRTRSLGAVLRPRQSAVCRGLRAEGLLAPSRAERRLRGAAGRAPAAQERQRAAAGLARRCCAPARSERCSAPVRARSAAGFALRACLRPLGRSAVFVARPVVRLRRRSGSAPRPSQNGVRRAGAAQAILAQRGRKRRRSRAYGRADASAAGPGRRPRPAAHDDSAPHDEARTSPPRGARRRPRSSARGAPQCRAKREAFRSDQAERRSGDGVQAVADLGGVGADVVEAGELREAVEAEDALEERRRPVADRAAGASASRPASAIRPRSSRFATAESAATPRIRATSGREQGPR